MKFLRLCGVGIFGLMLVVATSSTVFAQRSGVETDFASLLSRSCEETGRGSLFNSSGNVTVGRRLYEYTATISAWSSAYPYLLTCRVNTRGSRVPFGTLRLTIGHEDSSGDASEINFYLDGNLVDSYTLREGQTRSILFDVSNVEDFAIEATQVSGDNSTRIYIFDATLEPLY